MTVFWAVAGLLIVAALLFVLPPLLRRDCQREAVDRKTLNVSIYRDQLEELARDLQNDILSPEQFEQGRQELERRLLEDVPGEAGASSGPGRSLAGSKRLAAFIGVFVPLFAIGLYLLVGRPEAVSPPEMAALSRAGDENPPPGGEAAQIDKMVAKLAQHLEDHPDDAEGWVMLGRSYLVLRRFAQARAALEKAVALNKPDAQLLADYADSIAMTSGETLEGRPIQLIQQALAIDPENQKALWLAGTAAYERADFKQALLYWKRLRKILPGDSQDAKIMEGNITEAESLLSGRKASSSAREDGQSSAVHSESGRVSGTVMIDQSLVNKIAQTDTVFIFARSSEGPRMPLAVMRARAKDFPIRFSLDDSMAINPSMRISQFPKVVVIARLTKSGNATPQKGDLQGQSTAVRVGKDDVDIVIDRVLP